MRAPRLERARIRVRLDGPQIVVDAVGEVEDHSITRLSHEEIPWKGAKKAVEEEGWNLRILGGHYAGVGEQRVPATQQRTRSSARSPPQTCLDAPRHLHSAPAAARPRSME